MKGFQTQTKEGRAVPKRTPRAGGGAVCCAPYRGSAPYIFISYAHADMRRVTDILSALSARGYRIWYDEGIEAGAAWPETIAQRLSDAALVLVCSSQSALASQNCAREISYAADRKKNVAYVRLDDAKPAGGVGMQLSVAPMIEAAASAPEAVCDALEQAGCLTPALIGDGVEGYASDAGERHRPFNKWMLAALLFAVLFIAAALFAFGMTQGWFSSVAGVSTEVVETGGANGAGESVTVTKWSDSASRDLMLAGMNDASVYLCGNAFLSSASAISYQADAWRIGGQSVSRGDLEDLAGIAQKKGITQLALVYQSITDISEIAQMPQLTYLDISGNGIADISPLAALTGLKVLRILHIDAVDLSVLAELPALETVYISIDMIPRVAGLLDADFDIVIKD